jgi:hypothetical protein
LLAFAAFFAGLAAFFAGLAAFFALVRAGAAFAFFAFFAAIVCLRDSDATVTLGNAEARFGSICAAVPTKSSPLLLCARALALLSVPSLAPPVRADAPHEIAVAPTQWRVIERDSGPVNYYSVVHEGADAFVRALYEPPNETTVLGFQVPDAARPAVHRLRWKWRALVLPQGGNECAGGKEDSAAVVYATWKRGLRWYTLKYVWSSVGTKGAVCDRKRNPFVAQDTIILESGAPLGVWRSEDIDLKAEFRRHFEDGRADAEVPDFAGLGLMSDGDQTRSPSSADYGGFVIVVDR